MRAMKVVSRIYDGRGKSNVSRAGFTLIELLLVLVILGTLAAIVVPKFTGRTQQARITAAQTQIANLSTAIDAFEVDNGFYPRSLGRTCNSTIRRT